MSEPDLEDYAYELPSHCIAQGPAAERDGARLLVLDRWSGAREHSEIRALPHWLRAGDLLLVNATRVLPARLRGHKLTGGAAEALLLGEVPNDAGRYRALLRSRGRQRVGQKLQFGGLDAEIAALRPGGEVELLFDPKLSPYCVGETPLPPYIRRPAALEADAERYQTLYARVPGSVAAPTAGLHLSRAVLEALAGAGVDRAEVILHVGPGTFRPLGARELSSGRLAAEPFELDASVAERIAATRERGGRVVAVGTTTARVLESCVDEDGRVSPRCGETQLFLRPGSRFRAVDALLTNFHLPRSSLLLLVAAFAGRESILDAYAEAIRRGYRFYSYGDAMLIR